MNLVFHQAALGDFALILPLLRGMDGPTTLVAPWSRGRLACTLIPGLASMDIELFEFTRLHAQGGPSIVSPAVRDLFAGAQRVISFVSDGHDAWAASVQRLAPDAPLVCLPTRPPAQWAKPVGVWHRKTLLEQGVELGRVDVPRVENPGGPLVLHPGSGGVEKCWPAPRFEALLEGLRGGGRSFTVLLGEAEVERWPDEQRERWEKRYAATVCPDLDTLARALASASAFVGSDAGPTHLAAQMGLPTTALFGPTDPRVWSPQGPAVTVLAPPSPRPMDWLNENTVIQALAASQMM